MRARREPERQQRKTVLLVGEGKAEEYFLKHLKSLYFNRQSSTSITIKNAGGKGGKGVLDYALRQQRALAYDVLAVLLDTDADWDEAQRKRARIEKVLVYECSPCLEAILLRIHGIAPPLQSEACKRLFAQTFGEQAHQANVYLRHFSGEQLLDVREVLSPLNGLVELLRKG